MALAGDSGLAPEIAFFYPDSHPQSDEEDWYIKQSTCVPRARNPSVAAIAAPAADLDATFPSAVRTGR